MARIQEEIRKKLLSYGAVSGLIADRMWHMILAKKALPAVILRRISEDDLPKLNGGRSGGVQTRLQLRTVANTFEQAEEVAYALRTCGIAGFAGTLGNYYVSDVSIEDGRRDSVTPDPASNTRHRFRIDFDFLVSHTE